MGQLVHLRAAHPAMARAMTEDELLAAITEAATYLGWRWTHTRRSDLGIVQGHSGFPDLCLARDGVVMFLELKTQDGRPSRDQETWIEQLNGPIEPRIARIVRPADLDALIQELAAP